MRAGDSDRQIAQQQLLGRRKAAEFRELAQRHDWLGLTAAMPSDAAMDQALELKAPLPKAGYSVEA